MVYSVSLCAYSFVFAIYHRTLSAHLLQMRILPRKLLFMIFFLSLSFIYWRNFENVLRRPLPSLWLHRNRIMRKDTINDQILIGHRTSHLGQASPCGAGPKPGGRERDSQDCQSPCQNPYGMGRDRAVHP